jgi:hypothetical protein
MFYIPELQIDNGTHLNRYNVKPKKVDRKNTFIQVLYSILFMELF